MVFSAGLDQVPESGMVPAASLVAYAQLLALPGAELEQTVAAELAQNPALLRDEAPACRACGMPTDPPCPYCDAGAGGPEFSEPPALAGHRREPGPRRTSHGPRPWCMTCGLWSLIGTAESRRRSWRAWTTAAT